MIPYTRWLIFTIALGFACLFAPEARGALDAARWPASRAETPVWWDNLEGAPHWVSGPKPRLHRSWNMHAVSLQPGQGVTVHLPRWRALRVHHPASPLTRHDLALSLDNGSGLHTFHVPQFDPEGHSFILTPDAPGPFLVRITRPPEHQHPLTIALFLSRDDPLPAAPYRDVITLDLPMVRLQDQATSVARWFWSLTPSNPIQVIIEGPTRLAVDNRFVYRPDMPQPKQIYRIHTRLNGAPLQVLEFATDIQLSRPMYIGREPQPISRLEVDYLEIPPGQHILEIESTAPIYLRLRRQSDADYVLPHLNRPRPPGHREPAVTSLLREPIWTLDASQLRQRIESPTNSAVVLEHLAKRLWRDNRYRDGGLQAAMLLQRAATLRPYDAPLQRAAARQLSLSTTYRHLLPAQKTEAGPQYWGWFLTPRLEALNHQPTPHAAATSHQAALTSQLNSGYFTPLSAHPHTHQYAIPPRSAPSQLRIVVDTLALSQPQELWIQYDQQPPRRLHLRQPSSAASDPRLPLTPGEIGLALLRHRNPDFDHGTLGGPFSTRHQPARLLSAAYAVLPLPAHVQRVRLWQTYNRSETVSVALQYRDAQPFRLSERNYLDALNRLGSPADRHAFVLSQLAVLQHGPATFDVAELPDLPDVHRQRAAIEVMNQLLPLMRQLRARYKRFTDALTPPQQAVSASRLPDLAGHHTRAKQAEAAGDWLSALEVWGPIANTAQGELRREARLAQVRALQHLGRFAFADRLLRGMMLFDADAQLRTQAFNHLLTTYRQAKNTFALGTLLTVAAIRQLHPDALRMLVAQLAADGQYQSALRLGLTLPASQRPTPSLLQAAWRLTWWQTFDDLLTQLQSAEERHYWLGYRAVHQADYDTAQHHFLQAGVPGQALAGAIIRARLIHTDLRSGQSVKQEEAVLAWETWQARHPGPYTWRREPRLIADTAGSLQLYQPALDLLSQWYRSESERPVQLRFLGPLRLRLTIRPLHPHAASTPLDGWLRIDVSQQRYLVPIIGNRPAHDLTGIGASEWQPGQRITEELSFGPGFHTVTITGDTTSLLVQAEVRRPALPLGILPALTPDTLHAMLYEQNAPPDLPQKRRRHCSACLYVMGDEQTHEMSPLLALQRHRPRYTPRLRERLLDLDNRLRTRRSPPSDQENHRLQAAKLVYQNNVSDALSLPLNPSAEGLNQRLILLLWQAEHQPEQYEATLSAARALLAEHPNNPQLFSLFTHLSRRSKWQRVATVQRSAGVHFAEHRGWQPESPLLRANKALLRTVVDPDEQILTGQGRLLITFNNLKATTLDVALELDALPYAPQLPMTAVYQIDEQRPVEIQLPPSQPRRTVRLSLQAGQHALRFYIRNPAVNQVLRLHIIETQGTSTQPLQRTFERAYHVATHTEPVEILIAGPSWLRIDQWHPTGTRTRYQTIAAGWQTLTFHPKPGQPEAMFRFFQRLPSPEASPVYARPAPREPEPIPPPLARVVPLNPHLKIDLHDAYPLGRQEDGTWSFGSDFVSRRNSQEDVGLSDAERFAALRITHRYFNPFRHLYTETEALGRWRTDGGPTLGLKHILALRPKRRPLALRLSGTGFLQLPFEGTDLAASGTLRGTASYGFSLGPRGTHRPSISMFGRLLSLDKSDARNSDGRIDLDVFSVFKADHRAGLSLAETVTYRPWLDTVWLGKINVVTNQNLNPFEPDHLTLRLEWKQLIGPWQIHTAYRFGYFFADDDRSRSLDRHALVLDARWEHWRPSRHRFDVRLRTRYDLRSGDLGVLLGITWHTGPSRAYRDFRPGTINFRRLRQYRIPRKRINRLKYVEPS